VANIGQQPENIPGGVADLDPTAAIIAEYGELTKHKTITRRKAIGLISKRRGVPPNKIYEMLEAAKKSV
jgi:hypothetical protein